MRELRIGPASLRLMQGDITRVETEAIVNAANSGLRGGGGVDGAIHRAGGPTIMQECRAIGGCPTGEARLTGAGRLPARYIIHAVGPIWRGGGHGEQQLLASAYRASVQLAVSHGVRRIAFPSLSTGAYGYPIDLAASTALGTVAEFLRSSPATLEEVVFVLFSAPALATYEAALDELATRR